MGTHREKSDFENLKEVTSMGLSINRLSHRDVAVYR